MGSITIVATPQPTFTVSNPFCDKILSGQFCSVISCKFTTGNKIAMMAKMAGMDGMLIDMEHSPMNSHTVAQFSLACTFVGVSPIVRSPSKSHWHLSIILEAGAAATVNSPRGNCGRGEGYRSKCQIRTPGLEGRAGNQAMLNFQPIPTWLQNDLLSRETMVVIPMIETPSTVDLVEGFLAIEGVDGILIGSNVLRTDLGISGQYDHPVYQDAVTKIVLTGKKCGKIIVIGGIDGRLDLLEKWFATGGVGP